MSEVRRERLQGQIVRELSDVFQNRLRDPRRGFMSVTRVELSADLRHAKVYVSVLGGDEDRREAERVLQRALPFVRGELARRLSVRQVPEILFRIDESLQSSQRILDILDTLDIPAEDGSPSDGDAREDTR
jgi:ribosome-binding factor A